MKAVIYESVVEFTLASVKMFNKSDRDWTSRAMSASVGAGIAASFSIAKGQPPLVTLAVILFATTAALALDELGIV